MMASSADSMIASSQPVSRLLVTRQSLFLRAYRHARPRLEGCGKGSISSYEEILAFFVCGAGISVGFVGFRVIAADDADQTKNVFAREIRERTRKFFLPANNANRRE